MATLDIQSKDEALDCPFCGSRPSGIFRGLVTAVNCSNRDCIAYCSQVSIEQWQTRHPVTHKPAVNSPVANPLAEPKPLPVRLIEAADLLKSLASEIRIYGNEFHADCLELAVKACNVAIKSTTR